MKAQLEIGKEGEKRFGDWLSQQSFMQSPPEKNIKYVTDLATQMRGIDFRVRMPDGYVRTYEVKAEQEEKYGNFFIETWSNRATGRRGWGYTCESEYLVYTFLDCPGFYQFKMADIKEWLNQPEEMLPPEKKQGKTEQSNDSWGRPINIQKFLKEMNGEYLPHPLPAKPADPNVIKGELPSTHVLVRPRAVCDFETFSELDVRDVGAWAYAVHPSTEILCLAYKMPGKKTEIWIPGQEFPQALIDHIEAGYPVEAHNCQFERAIWTEVLTPQFFVPTPKTWIDTMATCAYRSVPLGLDKAGEALNLAIQKDKRGKYLISKLCQPRRPTKKDPSTRNRDPLLLAELYEYCKTDVDAEYELGEALGDLPKGEFSTWVMDQRINVRGVLVDVEAVHGALKIVSEITHKLEAELVTLTEGVVTTGGEVAKILKWCKDMGAYWLVNWQAGHLEDCLKEWFKYDEKGELIADKDDEFDNTYKIWRVLKIRQLLSRASTKKLIKFRDCRSLDDRIRCLLQYHGAGTGRWAGRGVQPQNFPRGALNIAKGAKFKPNDVIEALLACIRLGDVELLELHFGDPMEAIASSLRGMFVASPGKKFFVADFAAIEARVLMWLAGQQDAVDVFAEFDRAEAEKPGSGVDIYCAMATRIYGYQVNKEIHKDERQQGKVVILGCGYQMGGGALQTQAAQNYGVIITLERAKELVDIFRTTYSSVPAFWKKIEAAAIEAVKHERRTEVISSNGVKLGFEFVRDKAGHWLAMILPNGRKLWYFQPGLERKTIHYEDKQTGEMKSFEKDTLYYAGRSNKKGGAWTRVWSYGGMLTENAVQAIARDLMVAAMRRVEDTKKYEIVLTVHDELLAEGDENLDEKEFEHLVAGPNPAWAKGCPVAAEGWSGKRYRK